MKATVIITALVLAGCASPGSSAGGPSVQGAQTLTGQQGQAQETGSATVNGSPVFAVIFAASKVKMTTDSAGSVDIEVEGSEGAQVTVTGPVFGDNAATYGDNSMAASVTSGGGGVAGAEGGVTGGGGQSAGTVNIPTPTPVEPPSGDGQ